MTMTNTLVHHQPGAQATGEPVPSLALRACGIVFLMALPAVAFGDDATPSYARQVKPFLAKYCLECHSGDKAKGGLSLETYQSLQKGGDNGPVLVPGKPDESRIIQFVEGKDKLVMPPKKAKQPKPEERGLL